MRLLALLLLASSAIAGPVRTTYVPAPPPYSATWIQFCDEAVRYISFHSPTISAKDAERQALAIWIGVGGRAKYARRVLCLGGAESQYRLLAYLHGADPKRPIPRTDALGTHYITLARALSEAGFGPKEWGEGKGSIGWKKIKKTDVWAQIKALMVDRPDVGTYLAAFWYTRKAVDHELDGAVRVWQSGDPGVTLSGSDHVLNVRAEEWRFEKMNPRPKGGKKQEEIDETPFAVARRAGGVLYLLGRFREEGDRRLRRDAGAREAGPGLQGPGGRSPGRRGL